VDTDLHGMLIASVSRQCLPQALVLTSAFVETRLWGGANLSTPTGTTPVTDFDLRLLRVFKTIVEEGGLKPAQAALDVSLPTISKQLSDLEARFGARLCQRGSRQFELTPQGELIYKAAVELFAGIEQFRREADQVRGGQRGELRIGIMDNTISDPNCPLVPALQSLQSADLHLRLAVLDPDSVQQRVADGRLDIGLVPLYKKWPGLEYRTLYAERMYLYCGRGHRLFECDGEPDERELATYPFVEHGYVDGSDIEGFTAPAKTGATAWQVEAVAILLMTGRFLGYLPKHYAAPLEQQGKLRRLLSAKSGYRSSVAAVFKTGAQQSRPLRRLLSTLHEACSGHHGTRPETEPVPSDVATTGAGPLSREAHP
jgi:DNA-binding transcriptional LysR family regulator